MKNLIKKLENSLVGDILGLAVIVTLTIIMLTF